MNKKVLISLVLIGLLAFGAGFGSFAYFTSAATSSNNEFRTGTLTIGGVGETVTTVGFGNFYPGLSQNVGSITMKNKGTLPLKYKITSNKADGDLALYNILTVVVTSGDKQIFSGNLSALNAAIGELTAGATQDLKFDVTMPTSAGNEYQGKTVKVNFVFDATQTNNAGWAQ